MKLIPARKAALIAAICVLSVSAQAASYVDLTHPLATFEPSSSDWSVSGSSVRNFPKPNMGRPNEDSTGHTGEPSHEYRTDYQPVLGINPTAGDYVAMRTHTTFGLSPNSGTSIDAPSHRDVLDPEAVAAAIGFGLTAEDFAQEDSRDINELGLDELQGKVVLIDISERVQAEIDRVGGNLDNVDFSIGSGNNVTRADIHKIRSKLRNGCWIIIRTGWDQFFHSTAKYGNNGNQPGIAPEAVAYLVELEKKKRIRINGIGADNRSVDAGASYVPGAGSSPAHSVGLNRGWKLLENLTNLEAISGKKARKKMWLIVAPVNLIGAPESYARVLVRVGGK